MTPYPLGVEGLINPGGIISARHRRAIAIWMMNIIFPTSFMSWLWIYSDFLSEAWSPFLRNPWSLK